MFNGRVTTHWCENVLPPEVMNAIIDIFNTEDSSPKWIASVYELFIEVGDNSVMQRIVRDLMREEREKMLEQHGKLVKAALKVIKAAEKIDENVKNSLHLIVKTGTKQALITVLKFIEKIDDASSEYFIDCAILIIDLFECFANEEDIEEIV